MPFVVLDRQREPRRVLVGREEHDGDLVDRRRLDGPLTFGKSDRPEREHAAHESTVADELDRQDGPVAAVDPIDPGVVERGDGSFEMCVREPDVASTDSG